MDLSACTSVQVTETITYYPILLMDHNPNPAHIQRISKYLLIHYILSHKTYHAPIESMKSAGLIRPFEKIQQNCCKANVLETKKFKVSKSFERTKTTHSDTNKRLLLLFMPHGKALLETNCFHIFIFHDSLRNIL